MIKTCPRCGKDFDRHPTAKYCWDCVAELRREKARAWQQANPEKTREHKRRYKAANRERIRERQREYRLRRKLERESLIMKIIEPSVELVDDINSEQILRKLERCGKVSRQSNPGDPITFIRSIIKRGHESVLEHVSLTFHIVCDRAIMAELTRHRHASFTVESTRYVKYKDGLPVIQPPLPTDDAIIYFRCAMREVERNYETFIENGCPPEQARSVLPLCLATELYMTANLREWRHILKLRTDKAAHPQMRVVAGQILNILREKLPVIVEDITP